MLVLWIHLILPYTNRVSCFICWKSDIGISFLSWDAIYYLLPTLSNAMIRWCRFILVSFDKLTSFSVPQIQWIWRIFIRYSDFKLPLLWIGQISILLLMGPKISSNWCNKHLILNFCLRKKKLSFSHHFTIFPKLSHFELSSNHLVLKGNLWFFLFQICHILTKRKKNCHIPDQVNVARLFCPRQNFHQYSPTGVWSLAWISEIHPSITLHYLFILILTSENFPCFYLNSLRHPCF